MTGNPKNSTIKLMMLIGIIAGSGLLALGIYEISKHFMSWGTYEITELVFIEVILGIVIILLSVIGGIFAYKRMKREKR